MKSSSYVKVHIKAREDELRETSSIIFQKYKDLEKQLDAKPNLHTQQLVEKSQECKRLFSNYEEEKLFERSIKVINASQIMHEWKISMLDQSRKQMAKETAEYLNYKKKSQRFLLNLIKIQKQGSKLKYGNVHCTKTLLSKTIKIFSCYSKSRKTCKAKILGRFLKNSMYAKFKKSNDFSLRIITLKFWFGKLLNYFRMNSRIISLKLNGSLHHQKRNSMLLLKNFYSYIAKVKKSYTISLKAVKYFLRKRIKEVFYIFHRNLFIFKKYTASLIVRIEKNLKNAFYKFKNNAIKRKNIRKRSKIYGCFRSLRKLIKLTKYREFKRFQLTNECMSLCNMREVYSRKSADILTYKTSVKLIISYLYSLRCEISAHFFSLYYSAKNSLFICKRFCIDKKMNSKRMKLINNHDLPIFKKKVSDSISFWYQNMKKKYEFKGMIIRFSISKHFSIFQKNIKSISDYKKMNDSIKSRYQKKLLKKCWKAILSSSNVVNKILMFQKRFYLYKLRNLLTLKICDRHITQYDFIRILKQIAINKLYKPLERRRKRNKQINEVKKYFNFQFVYKHFIRLYRLLEAKRVQYDNIQLVSLHIKRKFFKKISSFYNRRYPRYNFDCKEIFKTNVLKRFLKRLRISLFLRNCQHLLHNKIFKKSFHLWTKKIKKKKVFLKAALVSLKYYTKSLIHLFYSEWKLDTLVERKLERNFYSIRIKFFSKAFERIKFLIQSSKLLRYSYSFNLRVLAYRGLRALNNYRFVQKIIKNKNMIANNFRNVKIKSKLISNLLDYKVNSLADKMFRKNGFKHFYKSLRRYWALVTKNNLIYNYMESNLPSIYFRKWKRRIKVMLSKSKILKLVNPYYTKQLLKRYLRKFIRVSHFNMKRRRWGVVFDKIHHRKALMKVIHRLDTFKYSNWARNEYVRLQILQSKDLLRMKVFKVLNKLVVLNKHNRTHLAPVSS